MRIRPLAFAVLLVVPTVAVAQLTAGTTDVVLRDKTVVQVESGRLQVPESRARPSRRQVTIPFYRLKSDASAPAVPIFLVAGGPGGSWRDLDHFIGRAGIELVPVDAEHGETARRAFKRFGKGRHRAGLNYGDCFSYALAIATGERLLFKGDDSVHTDVAMVDLGSR